VPTLFSHPAVPVAIALAAGRTRVSAPLLLCGIAASVLPDADVLAFRLGIPYADPFGHRGASHSLALAVLLGLLACAVAPRLRASRAMAFLFVGAACASHGLLDMLTDGGHGVAYFWPWSAERHFLPHPVIEVSTLNAWPWSCSVSAPSRKVFVEATGGRGPMHIGTREAGRKVLSPHCIATVLRAA
jgi:inner membrane protein